MAVSFVDSNGQRQQVELGGLALYREAMAKKISFRQLVNQKYPTAAGEPEAFKQFCVSAGLRFSADEATGIPAANLLEIFDPHPAAGDTFTSQPAAPDSRILFPAAIMAVIENRLETKEDAATAAFESLVGYRQTISTNKFEQPVLNYATPNGPESAQFQRISQNTRPPIMLSLTASDVTRKIPTTSIGMEISREALASNSLDIVALSMARFYKKANYADWVAALTGVLAGDDDAAVTSFSAGTSALDQVKADTLDSTIVANGVLTQKAYLAWLYSNSMSMTKTHLVMDYAAMSALENRTDRPTAIHNNSMDRMDVPYRVIYPTFQENINVIVMPAGTFAANTIMGLDVAAPALAKVTSLFADYSAVEDVVMKKSTELRIDRGWIVYRMWDEAFNVLSLTTT
jgi:hypothetical protein